jgi:hypothetical protein
MVNRVPSANLLSPNKREGSQDACDAIPKDSFDELEKVSKTIQVSRTMSRKRTVKECVINWITNKVGKRDWEKKSRLLVPCGLDDITNGATSEKLRLKVVVLKMLKMMDENMDVTEFRLRNVQKNNKEKAEKFDYITRYPKEKYVENFMFAIAQSLFELNNTTTFCEELVKCLCYEPGQESSRKAPRNTFYSLYYALLQDKTGNLYVPPGIREEDEAWQKSEFPVSCIMSLVDPFH